MQVLQQDFLTAISRVRRVVDKNHPVAMLRNLCQRDGLLLGYNQLLGVATSCGIDCDFCVPAGPLYRVVSQMGGPIEIAVEGNLLRLKSGGNTTRLNTTDPAAFPRFLPENTWLLCESPDLVPAMKTAAQLTAEAPGQPVLHGVGVCGEWVYATDGNRFVRVRLQRPADGEVAVPRQAVSQLVALGSPSKVLTNGAVLVAMYPQTGTAVVCALQAAEFPSAALAGLFEARRDLQWNCRWPDELAVVVQRVHSVTPSAAQQRAVRLSQRAGQLTVSCVKKEIGQSEETLPWDFAGEFDIQVDAGWLVAALKQTPAGNLADVMTENPRSLWFGEDGFAHILALRV